MRGCNNHGVEKPRPVSDSCGNRPVVGAAYHHNVLVSPASVNVPYLQTLVPLEAQWAYWSASTVSPIPKGVLLIR